jgi:hypothetical protein
MTDAEGAFIFRRGPREPDGPLSITANVNGQTRTLSNVDWGSHDVRIVMSQNVPLQISVVDGDDGSPVEQFGVQYDSVDGNRRWGTTLGMKGHHPGGKLRLSDIAPVTIELMVVPFGTGHLPSRVHRLEVTPDGAPPLQIPVYRPVVARMEVRDADGRPVAGSRAQLVRRGAGEKVTLETRVSEPVSSFTLTAAVTAAGETDASGIWTFSGPPHEPLTLLILGPGHIPVVEDIELAAAGQTVKVVVPRGARLTGTVTPGRFLDELPIGSEEQPPSGWGVNLSLERRQPRRESHPPGGRRSFAVGPSGSFDIEGIPAGTWDLVLRYPRYFGPGAWTQDRIVIENDVTLEPDQARHLDLDLSHLLRSRLRASVSVDGRPWIARRVSVRGGRLSPPRQTFRESDVLSRTDAEGSIDLSLWPGEYTVVALDDGVWLPDPQPVVIGPDTVVDRQLAFAGVPMELHVLRSDGISPAEGVRLRFRDDARGLDWITPLSDAEGRIRIAAITSGTSFEVLLMPRAGDSDGRPIPLGTMTATSVEGPQVVVLPKSSGY